MNILNRTRSTGITLVELLVALVLGVFLTMGVATVFLQNKSSYTQDDELARMQENARYAMRLISRELALAGLIGYYRLESDTISGTPTITNDCGTNWAVDLPSPIEFENNVSTTPFSSCIDAADILTGTDVLVIRRSADDFTVEDGEPNTDAGLTTAAINAIASSEPNRIYLKKDGLNYSFITGSSVTTADTTSGSGVDLWEYFAKVFYIRPYSDSAGDNIPTLCVESLNSASSMTSSCYVEGVENLQFEFGIDTDADGVPNQFKPNPTAAELADAIAVKVYLLIRSIDPISGYENNKTYTLGNTLSTPFQPAETTNGYFRRVYSTTVMLRNLSDV